MDCNIFGIEPNFLCGAMLTLVTEVCMCASKNDSSILIFLKQRVECV